jgi:hypothetical protein
MRVTTRRASADIDIDIEQHPSFRGVTRGVLMGITDEGIPLVDHYSNPNGGYSFAVSTVPITQSEIGREVILVFEDNDVRRPVVIGLVQGAASESGITAPVPPEAVIDGKTIVLSAETEIILRCGASSITLTRAGKILIRGTYVSSHSSGVNRIKGGSVQIN